MSRSELLELLRTSAFLYDSPDTPLRDPQGRSRPWMFYSWGLSLSADGQRQLGEALWHAMGAFESRVVASYGLTGLPLVTACLTASQGQCQGLAVRKDPKPYGTLRHTEGAVRPGARVVLVDDSLASGHAALTAIERLEQEGYRVEGVLALLELPGRGGRPRLEAQGYRTECLFDVEQDFGLTPPSTRPAVLSLIPERYADPPLPGGLKPAQVARLAIERYLAEDAVPRPPSHLDADYDGRGGVFVSLRHRTHDTRLGRDGFWHFPGEVSDPPRDVVLAAVRTVQTAGGPVDVQELKVAVTFFGPLEAIKPGRLSFPTHGIVVRSRLWNAKAGGALPNTQVFTHEVEQYRQARYANAALDEFEPHDLFRHTLSKDIEPDVEWPSYGLPQEQAWAHSVELGNLLLSRARDWQRGQAEGSETFDQVPEPVYAVAVSLFREGRPTTGMAWEGSLDDCLRRAVLDLKPGTEAPDTPDRLAVWLLHTPEWLGQASAQYAAWKLRAGLDSLAAYQGEHKALILCDATSHANRSKLETAEHALKCAGIESGDATWATFQTAAWVESPGGVKPLEYGLVARSGGCAGPSDLPILIGYLRQHLGAPTYWPCDDRDTPEPTSWASIYAAGVLLEASRTLREPNLEAEAFEFLTSHGDGHALAPLARCCLASALAARGPLPATLELWLTSLVQPDGRLADAPGTRNLGVDHDTLPGFAVAALGRLPSPPGLDKARAWYTHRFQVAHPWLQVAAQLPAWGSEAPELVFEMADWLLEFQHESSGAFLTELDPAGPSVHTAWLALGVARARALAGVLGDVSRRERYTASFQAALGFLDRLMIRPDDVFCMPAPNRCLGGIRSALNRTDVPLAGAAHLVSALLIE